MRCEVVAVGTELLLGEVPDTNSSWLGERLALAGIDSHFQTKVGDNRRRITDALRIALARNDAVIVCGGLGPTQDDITREAIADVLGVGLVRVETMVGRIREMFEARQREMVDSNARQADLPEGARFIDQVRGTAPGLVCPAGDDKVLYAVPGVPYEMMEMVERAVLPDLQVRAGTTATILSRVLRTWGLAESTLAERLAPRFDALEGQEGGPTLAFLASGMEGLKIRITAKSSDAQSARALLAAEEAEVRALLGDLVFGVDDETMEEAVGQLLGIQGLRLGLAESLTGGLVGSRLTRVVGSSEWFLGSIVSYAREVKFSLLGVPEGPVVSHEAAAAMAEGTAKLLGADVGLSVTGVAGPAEQDGQPVGTVFFGICLDGRTETELVRLPGDRERIRQFAAISLLDSLRKRLLARSSSN